MIESWSNLLNIALAVWVVWMGMKGKATGKSKTVVMYLVWAGLILGLAEVIDLLQIFPDGSMLSDLVYEKEIPVLVLLALAVKQLKGK